MKRPLFTVAVIQLMAAVISVWCLEYAGFSLTEYILVTLFIGIILLGAVMFYIRINMVPVFYFLVFILYPITIIQAMHISGSLDKIYDYESFSGTVDNIAYKNDYVMLYLKSNSLNAMGIVVYANSKAADNICVDDELIVYGTVKRFERERNPGNFNSYMYYTSGGYPYKCNADNIELVKGNSDSLKAQLYRLKQRIKNVYRVVFDEKACQLMNSMVLGDKYELDGDIKEMYQKSGMSHLLAISGLHISIAGMSVYRLLRKRLDRSISAVAGIIVILCYLMMTGSPVSAARAVGMLVIAIIADVRARTYDMLTALSIASVLQLLSNPYSVCNMSYIMSFLAILGIALVFPLFVSEDKTLIVVRKKYRKKRTLADELIYMLCDSLSCCIAVQITLMPAVLYYSYETTFISIILNCIVIPLMPVVMISGIITGIAGLISINAAVFFAGAADYILKFYGLVCDIAGTYGKSYVTGRPQVVQIVIYAIVLCTCIVVESDSFRYYMGRHMKVYIKNIVMIVLIVTAALNMHYIPYNGLYISMLDVGQGDCIYVRDVNGVNYLFDGGSTDIKNVGKYRIYPALRAMGVKRIDYIIISHTDADHINGIKELIDMCNDTFVIGEIVMPDIKNKENVASYMEMVNTIENAGIRLSYKKAGDRLVNGGDFSVTCMHPCADYDYEDINDFSAVYRIRYGGFSMMMMGDAGKKAEQCMMSDWNGKLNTSILKAGHHGSKYSSSEEFLEYISPAAALISCGIDNRYKHPHKEMLQRIEALGAASYRTDEGGAVIIKVDSMNMQIKSYCVSR